MFCLEKYDRQHGKPMERDDQCGLKTERPRTSPCEKQQKVAEAMPDPVYLQASAEEFDLPLGYSIYTGSSESDLRLLDSALGASHNC